MEFMERGSLCSMQKVLQKPPPLPLLFRLAHQVALGINFLHSRTRTILHLDLKPSNVLLDCSLNAKLTDFGLARIYNSMSQASKRDSENPMGTINYMPPEAFRSLSYTPTKATDIYSYGILLWSIATGKQPYQNAWPSRVKFLIPKGERPSLDEMVNREELAELKELMVRCWVNSPEQRPSSKDCTTETERLYEKHKHGIDNTVHRVLTKLKGKEPTEQGQKDQLSTASVRTESVNIPLDVPTGPMPVQEVAGGRPENDLRAKDSNPCQSVLPDRKSGSKNIKPSSVQPIRSSPPPNLSRELPQGSTEKTKTEVQSSKQYQRQQSSPNSHRRRFFQAHFSNITALQLGDNNTMHISAPIPFEGQRRRHRTAPSRIDRQPPQ
ncbi:receptor-interacting serine/threonine-protein kinase 3 isoform X2 [Salarias fasciatus]|nr:receptor-interacting serine/threonine-protein kinase 3-like isoform X2 [Salarias fasciatus]